MKRIVFNGKIAARWMIFLAMAALSTEWAIGQNTSLKSSSFAAGFGRSTGSGNARLTSSSGEPFVGTTKGMNYQTESGFISQVSELSSGQTILGFAMLGGWNMVSVPLTVGDYRKSALFPTGTTNAFAYNGTYNAVQTLSNGQGFWIKFSTPQQVGMAGYERAFDSVPLRQGWNMIGSISQAIGVSSLVTVPGGITTSQFYGYSGVYHTSTTIEPGKAYWVKTNQAGTLYLISSSIEGATQLHKIAGRAGAIRMQQSSEQPPNPPEVPTDQPQEMPVEFALYQNYPNPFNPVTVIRYNLPAGPTSNPPIIMAGSSVYPVSLKVYNMLGQIVATLVDEDQSPGYKSVTFDANNLASGMYMYKLSAGSFIQARKMVIVK